MSILDRNETDADLSTKKQMLDDFRNLAQDARRESEIDNDYYHNAFSDSSQLSPTYRAILKGRKQPEIVFNRVKAAINGIMGVAIQGKTDPRALLRNPGPKPQASQRMGLAPQMPPNMQMGANGGPPMQPQQPPEEPDLDAGDVATMALRYIGDVSNFQAIKIDVLENMAIEGCGAVEIGGAPNEDIPVTQIRWDEFFYDPRSRRPDFSDARFLGSAKWMYADEVKKLDSDKSANVEDAFGTGDVSGGADSSWMDLPEDASKKPAWADSKTRRLMVVKMYYRAEGEWWRCMFHAGGIIADEKSPYVDDKGKTMCGIEAQAGFVDRKNRRYGIVRDMRGPQDEINMRHIKSVHEMNTRQIQQDDPNAPPIDVDEARREAARPDGVIPPGWKVVPRQDVVANNIEMMQAAIHEIERMAPVPALLARGSADASGRAKQVDQQAGLTELARFNGRHTDWDERCNKQFWARARQFWSDPKWIRITDDEGAPQYVRINEPAPVDPMTGQPAVDPKTGQPAVKNHIAQMDVDIIVDVVPDTATLQQEIWSEFMKLASAYVGTPQQIPLKTLIKISPLPKKREVIKEIESDQAEAAQGAAPVQQIQQAQAGANVDKTKSETAKNIAQTKAIEIGGVRDAMGGHMEAHAAHVMPPGVAEVANLPQNQPQPTGP